MHINNTFMREHCLFFKNTHTHTHLKPQYTREGAWAGAMREAMVVAGEEREK